MITQDQKHHVLASYVSRLQDMLATAKGGASEAQNEANQHVGAMASRYDTFKEEAQYLAAGYSKQIVELSSSLALATALLKSEVGDSSEFVRFGSCVGLSNFSNTRELLFFLNTGLGGDKFKVDGFSFTAVSTASPMGQQLLDCSVGDVVLLANGSEEFEVDWIV